MVRTKKQHQEDSSCPATRRSTRLNGQQAQEPRDKSIEPQGPDVSERDESPPWAGMDASQLPEEDVTVIAIRRCPIWKEGPRLFRPKQPTPALLVGKAGRTAIWPRLSHHNRPRSSDDHDDDLDLEPPPKRRRNRHHIVQNILQDRSAQDTQRLRDARKRANQQHDELLHAQNQSLRALVDLTTEIKGMREDNRAARDAGETSRTTEILAEIVAKKF
ncbi:hypothetical protein B0H13DRAFT_1853353 [Mycena leptocephala]|nr:hypothetical protein B0H13DRAFT_1853353 [Mycena leptocephala]